MGDSQDELARRKQFSDSLQRNLDTAGRDRRWLGEEIARRLGMAQPITPAAVGHWLTGASMPEMEKVFAIEQALDLRPGTLSRLLGYLPPTARPVTSVPDAIRADPRLDHHAQQLLLGAYEALVRLAR